jgi:hypothetical protein
MGKKNMVAVVSELMGQNELRENIFNVVKEKGFQFKGKTVTKGRLNFTIKTILEAGIVKSYVPSRVIDKGRQADIKQMLEDGERLISIAKKYGFSKARAMQISKTIGINPKDVRQAKRVVLAKNINADIKGGASYCEIKSKYDMDGSSLHYLNTVVGNFNGTYAKTKSRRNDAIIERFKKGDTAASIVEAGLCNLGSIGGIYQMLSLAGVKRYPNIGTRSAGGWNDDPKVMTLINKYSETGFSAPQITKLLNSRGIKTQQGLKYTTANVLAKINAMKRGQKKAKK